MRRWNEEQHNGQGLAAEFEAYYKKLTEADKEVRSHTTIPVVHLTCRSVALQKGDVCRTGGKGECLHARPHKC
jgi:hypothetical protein